MPGVCGGVVVRLVSQWSVGQLVSWTVGRLDGWSDGRLVGWTVGQLGSWTVGRLAGWTDGRLVTSCAQDKRARTCERVVESPLRLY